MNSLRVLHVDGERGYGGGQRQLRLLGRELASLGVEQTLAVRPGSAMEAIGVEMKLPLFALAQRSDADLASAWRLAGLCRRLRPDIVHTHSARSLGMAALARGLFRLGRPPALVHTRRVSFPVKGLLGGAKIRRGADRHIAISRSAALGLLRAGVPESRLTVIPSGIELPGPVDRAAARAAVLELSGSSPGEVIVGACGNLLANKRFDRLVRAVAALRPAVPVRLVIWGDGPQRGPLEALCRELGAGVAVFLAGHVETPERYFPGVDVVALASEAEGLGSVLLDAMARGVPLLGADAPGINEAIEDGVNGVLFDAGSANDLLEKLRLLVLDAGLRERLGAAGPRRAAERFDIRVVAARTLDLYRKAAGAP